MKQKYKIMLVCLCAVVLMAATALGTLAYLTDQEAVTNTMTVGKVYISLDEAKVTAEGKLVDGAERVTENEYHLIPGQTYIKDPIVTVEAGSEDCYVYVKIENEIAAIEADTTIATQISQCGWAALEGVDGVYYIKVTKEDAADGEKLHVFNIFTIKGEVDNETLAEYQGKKVNVTAYAIQQAGFADAKAAWTAANFS